MHAAWWPKLEPRRWTAVVEGKLAWFPSVTEVNPLWCEEQDIASHLTELRSMPSLHSLRLPASWAERAVDAEAVYGLTTLTYLSLEEMREDEEEVMEGEWVLDLSRLTRLSTLELKFCRTARGEQMEAVSNLTGLTKLNLVNCINVPTKGLCAVRRLTALTFLFGNIGDVDLV